MACTSAGDSKELSGLVALKATSSASLLFLANLLHNSDSGKSRGQEGGRGGGGVWKGSVKGGGVVEGGTGGLEKGGEAERGLVI